MKPRSTLSKLFFSLLMVLVLTASGLGPALAQDTGPDENSSQQPGTAVSSPQPVSSWNKIPELPKGDNSDPNKAYVAGTWGDNAVHFLDVNLVDTGSFAIGDSNPNGVATDGAVIYTGHFSTQSVRAFDYNGVYLGSFSDPAHLSGLQGLELVNGELAVYASDQVHFFTTAGVYLRSIPAPGSTEGLAFEGGLLWTLSDANIYGINPADGALVATIPNAAVICSYDGTAMAANAPGQLTLGCDSGSWYIVSTADGSVLSSGNNGLQMYGLGYSFEQVSNPVYIRSTAGQPWGQSTNEAAMDAVFGPGNWQDLRYETVNPAVLFSAATSFIYMEGSDNNASELEAFLAANQALLESWVASGGRLLLNAAPNEGVSMSFGFGGVTLTYPGFSGTGNAVDPLHPIFNGPFTPVGTSFTGGSFSHASVSGGGVTDLMTGDPGTVPLAELYWGSGLVAFGGMTTTNFHSPQPEAFNLRANLLDYLAFSSTVNDPPVAMDDGVAIFFEDFESGYGAWSMEDLWNQENEADTCGAMVAPFPSPSNAAYFGQDGICTYDTDYIPAGSLTLNTPVTLPPNSAPHLKFDSFEQTEDACGAYDFRYVEVSADGGTNWDTLGYLCIENAWYEAEFDISAYSGEDILIRFRFNSGDGAVDAYFGWMVDDIAITTSEPFVTDENSAYNTPSVLDNDFDPNLDPLFVESYDGSGLLGTLISNGNGTFLYDPNGAFESLAPGEQAAEVFSYVVTDGVLTDTANVTVIVTGVDDMPVTVEDYYSSPEDAVLDVPAPGVLGNDYDPEGDPFTAALASPPAVGDLTFNADGSFTYAPLPESSYVVTFTYVISYGEMYGPQDTFFVGFGEAEFPEGTPVDGHVVTTLDGLPIPPLSFDVQGTSGYTATFTVLGPMTTTYNLPPNIEGSPLDTFYIDLGTDVDSAGFSFVLACSGTISDAVTVTAYAADMSPVGTYSFDSYDFGYGFSENWVDILPGTAFRSLQIDLVDFCAAFVLDNLTYQQAAAAPTLVTLDIFAVNDPPVADDLTFTTDEDIPYSGMLTAFDIEGDPLGFSLDSGPAHGTVDVAAGGGFTYTPDENYNGADSFTFIASDGDLSDGGQVDITISSVNDDPIVDAGQDQQSEESAPISFAGTFSDARLLNPQAVEIAWDFGDGETASGTLTPTHTYADDGDYTVTLVITDELGAAGTDSLLVSVANVAPLLEPVADQDVEAGQQLTVTAFLSDPGWMDSHTLDVDWGDGITETIVLPYGTQEFDLSHAFTEAGTYTVSVTVTDDDGGTHAITFTVNVSAMGYWTFLPMTQK